LATNTGKLSVREKIGYSLGDASANFVFMTMILFQSKFYTDTFGLEASIAGTLLLVGRLWDAFFDPMMGTIADRTNTRWGKFRPWVLWTALPWGVAMVLAYTTPNFSMTGMIIYAVSTNILLMTLYSANNTPYSAMLGVMTGDGNERTSLSSYRFVAAMLAQLIVGGFTLPLVAKFGQGDDAKGWQMTLGLWAIICVVFFVITFLSTRERIKPDPKQKSSPKEDFRGLLKNRPWIAMFAVTLAHFIFVAMRGGTMAYYFDYYVDKDALFNVLQSVGLAGAADGSTGGGLWHYLLSTFGLVVDANKANVSSVGFSLFNMSGQFVTVIGVLCSTFLAFRFGKKAVALAGFSLSTIFLALFILLPVDAVGTTFILEYLRALSYAPTIPLLWAMFADVADYTEWKTGRRITGVIFATVLFALKAGLSLGGAIALWLLSGFGYQPNAIQTPGALYGIRMTISIFPAIFLCIVIVCLIFYTLNKKMNLQIQNELTERRKSYQ
jgi:Na+/melibiose symporter-like transporter